jgi:hypothetical protein
VDVRDLAAQQGNILGTGFGDRLQRENAAKARCEAGF